MCRKKDRVRRSNLHAKPISSTLAHTFARASLFTIRHRVLFSIPSPPMYILLSLPRSPFSSSSSSFYRHIYARAAFGFIDRQRAVPFLFFLPRARIKVHRRASMMIFWIICGLLGERVSLARSSFSICARGGGDRSRETGHALFIARCFPDVTR